MKNRIVVIVSILLLIGMGGLISLLKLGSRNEASGAVNNSRPTSIQSKQALTESNASNAAGLVTAVKPKTKPAGFNPYASALKTPGKSKRAWDVSFMEAHQNAVAGEAIEFELTDGRVATGVVRITQYRHGELSYFSGDLTGPEKGEFFF